MTIARNQRRRFPGIKGIRPDRKATRQREAIARLLQAGSKAGLIIAKATFAKLRGGEFSESEFAREFGGVQ